MRSVIFLIALAIFSQGCLNEKKQAEVIFQHYLDQKTGIIRNYTKESSLALWNASVSGSESDYKKVIDIELEFNKSNRTNPGTFSPENFSTITRNVFTSEEDFELLTRLKKSGLITDSLLSRQLIYLYHVFTGSQIESDKYKNVLESGSKLSHLSSTMEYHLDGRVYKYSQLDSIRRGTVNGADLERIDKAYQEGSKKLAPEIIKLTKGRNEIARILGFPDFYHVKFEAGDESPEGVKLLLDEIEKETRDRYLEAKRVIDKKLAKTYGIRVEELRPWHYKDDKVSYLPQKFTAKLDSLLLPVNPVDRVAGFFAGIGLNIQPIIDKSELRNGTMNAMVNIDFRDDVRLVGRITNSFDGLTKMLHLAGHAAHYSNIPAEIPYLLQGPSLIIAEGIARYFENMAYDPEWLTEQVNADEKTKKEIELIMQHFREVDQLFRIRKQLVVADFEREIYSNPDQDLDRLWRNLNIKYLDIYYPDEKGACYWAMNKYFTSLPCYIQNNILADAVAAQLKHAVEKNVLNGSKMAMQNNARVGEFLTKKLFAYGDLYPWEELIVKATGEPIRPQYFADEITGDTEPKQAN